MSNPTDLIKAFKNMKAYTEDHMVTAMRPELRQGILEAIKIFEAEIFRLKSENAELESRLELAPKNTPSEELIKTVTELKKPGGPITIGRPYPVYMICYICEKRILTITNVKSSGGCCMNCLAEAPPLTVLHSCPICHTYLGIYNDNAEEET